MSNEVDHRTAELAVELEGLSHGTVIQLFSGHDMAINVALRIDDLDGLIGWALAGVGKPSSSERVARGIAVAKGYYKVLVDGDDDE
jgi:hypothetical protein